MTHVIDQLGEIQAQISGLQATEAALKIKVIASVDAGKDAGKCYEAAVIRTFRTFTPLKACKAKLLVLGCRRWLRDHTQKNLVTSVVISKI